MVWNEKQGPRSNFEMGGRGGGAPLVTQYWRGGGTKYFFLLILYNLKNIGWGTRARPPGPFSAVPEMMNEKELRWLNYYLHRCKNSCP